MMPDDGNRSERHGRFVAVASAAWLVPAIAWVLDPGGSAAGVLALLAGAATLAALAVTPRLVALGLPFLALLSPIGGYLELAGIPILLTDGAFLIIALQEAGRMLVRPPSLPVRALTGMPALFMLFFLSSAVVGWLTGTLIGFKPLLYLLQVILVVVCTHRFARTGGQAKTLLVAWGSAAVLAVAVQLSAFANGLLLSTYLREGVSRTGLTSDGIVLPRSDYFYTNVHLIYGALAAVMVVALLGAASRREKLLAGMGLAAMLLALAVMLNKSSLFGAGVAVAGVMVVNRQMASDFWRTRFWYWATIIALTGFGVVWMLFRFLGDLNTVLWVARLTGYSSLTIRFAVFRTAFEEWVSNPMRVLIGMGPDFLDGSGTPSIAVGFKTGSGTGVVEGTVDSGLLSYAIELGLPAFLILLTIYWTSVRRVLGVVRSNHRGSSEFQGGAWLLGGLLFIPIALVTQMLGYSKVAWFAVQLVAFGRLRIGHGR